MANVWREGKPAPGTPDIQGERDFKGLWIPGRAHMITSYEEAGGILEGRRTEHRYMWDAEDLFLPGMSLI